MIQVRPSNQRGRTRLDWLDSRHSFSFGEYHDPMHMGFRSLRVLNEDWVDPDRGFGTHPHRNMEILTWVLSGAVRHADSTGEERVVRAGELQRMTAGRGIRHSEWNASATETLHLLQIWILPEQEGLPPGYEQRDVAGLQPGNGLVLAAAREAGRAAVQIHQDAALYIARMEADEELSHNLEPGRGSWLQVSRGSVDLQGVRLEAGDGASIEDENIRMRACGDAEILLFDFA